VFLRRRETAGVPLVANASQQRSGDAIHKGGGTEHGGGAAKMRIELGGLERPGEDERGIDDWGCLERAGLGRTGCSRSSVLIDEALQVIDGEARDLSNAPACAGGGMKETQPFDIGVGIEPLSGLIPGRLDGGVPPFPYAEEVLTEGGPFGGDGDGMPRTIESDRSGRRLFHLGELTPLSNQCQCNNIGQPLDRASYNA